MGNPTGGFNLQGFSEVAPPRRVLPTPPGPGLDLGQRSGCDFDANRLSNRSDLSPQPVAIACFLPLVPPLAKPVCRQPTGQRL